MTFSLPSVIAGEGKLPVSASLLWASAPLCSCRLVWPGSNSAQVTRPPTSPRPASFYLLCLVHGEGSVWADADPALGMVVSIFSCPQAMSLCKHWWKRVNINETRIELQVSNSTSRCIIGRLTLASLWFTNFTVGSYLQNIQQAWNSHFWLDCGFSGIFFWRTREVWQWYLSEEF